MARAPHLLIAVRRFLEARGIVGQAVVVAVSGGADSVALLRVLSQLREPLGLRLIAAHFDHGLRADSARDGEWVSALAGQLDVECVVARAVETPPNTGIEVWARRWRYMWLRNLAQSKQANWVAVAHTADDQVETVLHHIVRGTGLAGLAGMPAVRLLSVGVRLVRPCLEVRRTELREYLASLLQHFLNDPTNEDSRWTRNEIRHELIPRLEERFNPKVVDALLSLSRQAADAARVMRRQAAKLLKRAIVEATPECVRLKTGPFVKADAAVVREAAVRLWRTQGWPRQRMAFRHWEAAAELFKGDGPPSVEWPGSITGVRRGALVAIAKRE